MALNKKVEGETNAVRKSGYFPACNAVVMLKIEARPGFTRTKGCSSARETNENTDWILLWNLSCKLAVKREVLVGLYDPLKCRASIGWVVNYFGWLFYNWKSCRWSVSCILISFPCFFGSDKGWITAGARVKKCDVTKILICHMIGIVWYIQKEQDKKRHPIFINRFIFSKTITYNLLHQRYKLP